MLIDLLQFYARHFPIQRGKYRIVEKAWNRLPSPETNRTARLVHGNIEMRCNLDQALQRQFFFFGTYFLERENLSCWERRSTTAHTIFDVGANLGIYSLAAAAANRDARIFSFEPTPEIAARLRDTIRANEIASISVIEKAVSDRNRPYFLNIWGAEEEGNEGLNFVTEEPVAQKTVAIQGVTLDDFASTHAIERIDLLKLDIQGNEPAALRGAANLLAEGRISCVFVELNWASDPNQPCAASEVIDLLAGAGFSFAPPIRKVQPQPPGDWMRKFNDIVATL